MNVRFQYIVRFALPSTSSGSPMGFELRAKAIGQEHSYVDRSRVRNVEEDIQ